MFFSQGIRHIIFIFIFQEADVIKQIICFAVRDIIDFSDDFLFLALPSWAYLNANLTAVII